MNVLVAKTLEEKKIQRLYELLEDIENEGDDEKIASLRWAIFELERLYVGGQSADS